MARGAAAGAVCENDGHGQLRRAKVDCRARVYTGCCVAARCGGGVEWGHGTAVVVSAKFKTTAARHVAVLAAQNGSGTEGVHNGGRSGE